MFKKILLAVMLMSPALSFAATSDCDISDIPGLDAKAMAEIRVECEQKLLDAATGMLSAVDMTNPQALSQWGTVAQEWAKALGVAAKELGIAANEFLDTDAGMLTAFIIIWQVMGEDLMGIIIGVPLLLLTLWIGFRFAYKSKISRIKYGEPTGWRNKRPIVEIVYHADDETVMYWVAFIATVFLSFVIVAGVIF